MKFTHILHSCLLILAILFLVSLAYAEEQTTPTTSTATSSTEGSLRDRKMNIKNEIQNLQNDKEGRRDTVQTLKNDLASIAGRIVNGTVTAVTGTTFTISNKGKTLIVTTDANTKCERHYFGQCSLSEIAVNDRVNVWGNFTDETRTTLQAKFIRDASIMKKHGVFLGNVLSKGDNSFVIQSKERGTQTVNITPTTKFVQRNELPSSFTDLQVGHRVRVKGVWDKANNTVSEVTEVKNYSIPAQVDKRVPPVASPSASPSPTTTP